MIDDDKLILGKVYPVAAGEELRFVPSLPPQMRYLANLEERAATAEAKLAKAMNALMFIANQEEACCNQTEVKTAKQTLEEIKPSLTREEFYNAHDND